MPFPKGKCLFRDVGSFKNGRLYQGGGAIHTWLLCAARPTSVPNLFQYRSSSFLSWRYWTLSKGIILTDIWQIFPGRESHLHQNGFYTLAKVLVHQFYIPPQDYFRLYLTQYTSRCRKGQCLLSYDGDKFKDKDNEKLKETQNGK